VRIILAVLPLSILLIALATGNLLVMRLFVLSLLVLLLSYLWARMGLRGLSGRLTRPGQRCFACQAFDVEASVRNGGRLPRPFLRLTIKSDLPEHENKLLINLPSMTDYSWHSLARCSIRGRYRLGPLEVESADPFVLFRLRSELDKAQDVLVYPNAAELPFFWAESQAESGTGRNSWLTTEAGSVVFGIREYVPGDSLNRIHWRSSAHSGKLIVKDFDIDLSEKVWLLSDLCEETMGGSGSETTVEYVINITASILKRCTDLGRHVGMIAQSNEYIFFPPRAGHQNMWRIMDVLAVVNGDGQVPLNRIIDRAEDHFTGNSIAVIITASSDELVADAIIRTSKRGIPVVVILLDADSFQEMKKGKSIAPRLNAVGIPVYAVKKGDDIASVLNSQGRSLSAKLGKGYS
jgi:uncharacterized protein (DUF58 family)